VNIVHHILIIGDGSVHGENMVGGGEIAVT
jgi:hypothetical protein